MRRVTTPGLRLLTVGLLGFVGISSPALAQLQTQGLSLGRHFGPIAMLTGVVKSVGSSDYVFTCLWQSTVLSFKVTPDTSFKINGAAADFSALLIGDQVTVSYVKEDPLLIAQTVSIIRSRPQY